MTNIRKILLPLYIITTLSLFSCGTTRRNLKESSPNENNETLIDTNSNPVPYVLSSEYLSIEDAKKLPIETNVTVEGIVSTTLDNNEIYISDELSGIGINVKGLDSSLFNFKDKIVVSGAINVLPNGVKYIDNATFVKVSGANYNIKVIEVDDIANYFKSENVGNMIKIKDVRYWELLSPNCFTFKRLDNIFNLCVSGTNYLAEETKFLNAIGALKEDSTPLIQLDSYKINLSYITGILTYQDEFNLSLFQNSKLDLDYKSAMKSALLIGTNTKDQCKTQFRIAKTFLLSSPKSFIDTFKSSKLPDIISMRERYEAWAAHLNLKAYEMDNLEMSNAYSGISNTTIIIIVTSILLSGVAIAGFVIYRFKHKSKKD